MEEEETKPVAVIEKAKEKEVGKAEIEKVNTDKLDKKKVESEKPKHKIKIKVSKSKVKAVEDLAELINKSNTLLIASIKNLPGKQFQLIKKELRGQALIRVLKKSLVLRTIDKIEKGVIKNLKNYIQEDIALLFSELDPFELSAILSDKKSPAKAKIGQIAPEDIVIEPGPTDLVPGPAISELGSLGIQIAVEDGKINIKEKKIIVKRGEAVSENAAGIMSKLDITPFSVGFEPLVAYDNKAEKIYSEIKIDKEDTLEKLKELFGRSLGFAINIGYICKDTLRFILGKAVAEEKVLSGFIKEDSTEEGKGKEKMTEAIEEKKGEERPEEKVSMDKEKKEETREGKKGEKVEEEEKPIEKADNGEEKVREENKSEAENK